MRGADDVARGFLLSAYILLAKRACHYQHVCEIDVNARFSIARSYRRG